MTFRKIYMALRKRILLTLKGRYFVISRNRGLIFLADILNYIDREIEAFGEYEAVQVSGLLEKISESNATHFVDIGANLGIYSLAVAKSCPNCEILAFEPDRRNFSQLHANIFLNDLQDRIRVEPYAISAAKGSARFYRYQDENRGRSGLSEDGSYMVETRRLDDLLQVSGKKIVVKIDVEGREQDVISGAINVLASNDCLLQIESFDPDRIERKLAALGYRLTVRMGNDLLFEKMAL